MIKSILTGLALTIPSLALGQAAPKAAPKVSAAPVAQPLTLNIQSFIAREIVEKGVKKKVLLVPDSAVPGDAVVYMLNYANVGTKPIPASIDDPVPDGVFYTGVEQPWAVVSVDNGKTFGPLATLKVKTADGKMRAAVPQDVSHVRWKFAQPLAPGSKGRVMFFAVVK